MPEVFCLECAAELFGPEAWERMGREVDKAPPFSPEQRMRFRALFQTVLHRVPSEASDRPKKDCGH